MDRARYIDPMIGTVGDEQDTSMHGGGKTHPGACTPGGMVQLSPDTVTGGDNGTGYNYCQNTIEGFSFNHMSGIGWYGDLGNIQIMPIVGQTDLRSGSNEEVPFVKGKKGWRSEFSHEREQASAGYYSVFLDRYGITAEATATERTGILRLTYPENNKAGIIFNFSRRIAGHADFESIKIIDNKHIEGHIHCTPNGGGFGRGAGGIGYELYFYMELSTPMAETVFFSNEEHLDKRLNEFEGEDVGLLAYFDKDKNDQITVKCAVSYVDLEGARLNFHKECENIDFDSAHMETAEKWNKALECVDVEGNNETDKTIFYTCLYRSLLDPRTSMDADGRYRTADGKIKSADYTHRTMFSGWDVYRSEFPLLTIIRPDMVNDEINSLLNIALSNNSSFPRWELMGIDSGCMVGDPGLIVFADSFLKGIKSYDVDKAYEICLASSKCANELYGKPFVLKRPYSEKYRSDAYVPGCISETLEFLLADYCMYRLAAKLGRKEDADYFLERVSSYKNNFNPITGFMGARNENGDFAPVKDEYDTYGCVESNIFQQSWFVPYDVIGLCDMMGKERAISLLEKLFSQADFGALWNENYNHSNEPCHNITHYFNILGLPRRTQYWTRRVQKEAYRLGAFGFCGNEDVGQLSAWYVLSALGFAQVCPANEEYYINTPLFKKAKITLDPEYHSCKVADTLEIECDKDPLDYPYIAEMYHNGIRLDRYYLRYSEITAGGKLEFKLTK
ncbi:MAG: GH92 family glycosyl hydrolase [Clostridia bacterium]|nr:GH92 family glycosyl hydrolase [Clostridia bacterium]